MPAYTPIGDVIVFSRGGGGAGGTGGAGPAAGGVTTGAGGCVEPGGCGLRLRGLHFRTLTVFFLPSTHFVLLTVRQRLRLRRFFFLSSSAISLL